MKLFNRSQLFVGLAALCFLFSSLEAWAADTPIGATAIYVEGEVKVVAIEDGVTRDVSVGDSFIAGDKITTGIDGVVEIKFDTGNKIRIDNESDLTIKSLHRNSRGSTFSIFKVAFGSFKSRVAKLNDSKSKFEYQTKAAIAGVGGTPDWFIFAPFPGDIVNVDLMGQPGDEGQVYVVGLDSVNTMVNVTPGFSTTVNKGSAPFEPSRTSPQRRSNLQNFSFQSPSQGDEEPQTQPQRSQPTGEQTLGGVGPNILMNSLSRRVSVPRRLAGGQSLSLEEGENQLDQGTGLDSGGGEDSGSTGPVLFHGTATIHLK